MKKKQTQTVIIAILIAASIGSFAYLNLAKPSIQGNTETTQEEIYTADDDQQSPSSITALPDVRFVQKTIELGKKILPSS